MNYMAMRRMIKMIKVEYDSNNVSKLVSMLINRKETVATMESCTGGALASEITNAVGASEVIHFSAVTYSNEYKIKMGVNANVIERYSVYSIETACEMARNISKFANSDYGIGITGKINAPDPNNNYGKNDEVYIVIYCANTHDEYRYTMEVESNITRLANKQKIVDFIIKKFLNILSLDAVL